MQTRLALIAAAMACAGVTPAHSDDALTHWARACEDPQLDPWVALCAKDPEPDPAANRHDASARSSPKDQPGGAERPTLDQAGKKH